MKTIRRQSVLDRFWRAILDRSFGDVPHPTDAPFAHSTGINPYRVLIFGSGTAVGWGMRSHELALPGHLARELGERTSRGVDVDLIAEKRMTAHSAVAALEGRLIAPYDAIVVSLGMTDSLRLLPARTFRVRMRAILAELSARTSPETRIVLLGMQPVPSIPFLERGGRLLDSHAARLDRVLVEVSREFPKGSHVGMSPIVGPHAGDTASAQHYRGWARELAEHLAPLLESSDAPRVPQPWLDEHARQDAVRQLSGLPAGTDGRFDKIAELARSAFSADVATVGLMDGDVQRMIGTAGMDPVEMPRTRSFGEYALFDRAGFVVGDAAGDRRFSHLYGVSIGMRFYAGYPLHAPNGRPVGTLAVLSSEPRAADSVDLDLLRELALLAQRELWMPEEDSGGRSRTRGLPDADG